MRGMTTMHGPTKMNYSVEKWKSVKTSTYEEDANTEGKTRVHKKKSTEKSLVFWYIFKGC